MKKMKGKYKDQLLSFLKDFIIAIVVVVIINTFFVQNLRVQGKSMAPILQNNDRVILNRIAYVVGEPKKGDIIGFYTSNVTKPVVKRIVGLPGDLIDYIEGQLYVNGVPINELNTNDVMYRGDIKYPFKVPKDTYFVLGDNYNSSIDSRFNYIGCVPKDNIIGRIDLKIWPSWENLFLK